MSFSLQLLGRATGKSLFHFQALSRKHREFGVLEAKSPARPGLFAYLFIIMNVILSLDLACGPATCYNHESYLLSAVLEEIDEIIEGVNEPLFFLDPDRTHRDNLIFVNVRQIGGIPPFSMPFLERSPPSPGGPPYKPWPRENEAFEA